ncbi:hypothetical protein [Neoaquamicrobium microcysteis]|uniref:hypothetical protein n=1 Tax=Neoaquamicrobium microcysteis TaxID=2682781 RepID=UPI001375D946|nr:hypothetical protein [Mesorhizobium microcysteis]
MIIFSKKTSTAANTDNEVDMRHEAMPTEDSLQENRFEQIRRKAAEGHSKSAKDYRRV